MLKVIMLCVVILNVVMLTVLMLSVVMLCRGAGEGGTLKCYFFINFLVTD
jgi:hypothetical protein